MRTLLGNLDRLHDWLATKGIRFVFVVAPDKSEIYPEHLPEGVPAFRAYYDPATLWPAESRERYEAARAATSTPRRT